MKKLLSFTVVLALVFSMFSGWNTFSAKAADSLKTSPLTLTPSIKKVKVKLPKVKGVSYFNIYKVKITKKTVSKNGYSISKKKFKKIATVSGSKRSYKDKKVKLNKEYAYYVDGFKKKGGKSTLRFTSYRDSYDSTVVGLDRPSIYRYYSDNYLNSADRVYFHLSYGNGIVPKKYYIYRKAAGESKYKKLKIKPFPNSDDDELVYCDSAVKANVKYKYKVKTYYKKGKKKYYSKYSEVYSVTPCSDDAHFKIECITPAGSTRDFVLKLTGDKKNGVTKFYYINNNEEERYGYQDNENNSYTYKASIIEYSYDNVTWKSATNINSFKTKSNEIIYLKFRLTIREDDTSLDKYVYGANNPKYSQIEMESSVDYMSPNSGSSHLVFDLIKGTGTIYNYSD